jgi:hypothetical protein
MGPGRSGNRRCIRAFENANREPLGVSLLHALAAHGARSAISALFPTLRCSETFLLGCAKLIASAPPGANQGHQQQDGKQ